MIENFSKFFLSVADELVDFAENDLELADGLRWIDQEAFKRGITFYEMLYIVLDRADVTEKAKEWRQNKIKENG